MAITAEDIQNVGFTLAHEGYDVDEVDVFLERVADEVDAMNRQIVELQFKLSGGTADEADDAVIPAEPAEPVADEQAAAQIDQLLAEVEDLKRQLAEKKADDAAISQALIVAQRSADDIIASAKSQAASIVQNADNEAVRIVDDAENGRQGIIAAIQTLESDREDVRMQYREMLTNFMADAQKKLADIDGDARRSMAAAQARTDAHAASYAPLEAFTVGGGAPAQRVAPAPASAYVAPAPQQFTQSAAPVQPETGYVDKDFSGFGDTADDFGFDDLD